MAGKFLMVLVFVLGLTRQLVAQTIQEADGFDYPVGNVYRPTAAGPAKGDYDGWHNPNYFGYQPFSDGCFHSGDDWNFDSVQSEVGQPVKAIGHGRVKAVTYSPVYGGAVAIEHHYRGRIIFSIYWHLNTSVSKDQDVERGHTVGGIGNFPGVTGPHSHTELREQDSFTDFSYPHDGYKLRSCAHAGYYASADDMTLDHLIDPTKFIDEHRVAHSHPSGSVVQVAGDDKVYYIHDAYKHHIEDINAFNLYHFDWRKVIIISPEEGSCYTKVNSITTDPKSFSPRSWNGHREGSLVKFTGSEKVYVVTSDEKLLWINVPGDQFTSLGYDWANLEQDLAGAISDSDKATPEFWTLDDFKACAKEKGTPLAFTSCVIPPPIASLGNEITLSIQAPLPKGHYDSDPFVISFRRADGSMGFLVAGPSDIALFDEKNIFTYQVAMIAG